jgi:hypothetical protein
MYNLRLTWLAIQMVCAVMILCSTTATIKAQIQQESQQSEDTVVIVAQQTNPQSGGLQRGTPPSTDEREKQRREECERRHAEWDRNLPKRSAVFGAILYTLAIYFLTFFRFSTTLVRVFWSFVAAVIFGPAVVGLQKYDALKVCPSPPGFLGILTADLFGWTLFGIALIIGLFAAWRYVSVVRRKFHREQVTS